MESGGKLSTNAVKEEAARRPVAIDLFSGAGGLSLGLEQAGFDVLAAVDADPVHALAYGHNFPATTVLCDDVARLGAADLGAAARSGAAALGRAWTGEVDCLAGGPSCQGFSVIGARDPSDPRNSLVFEFARIVSEIQPRYFVLENVPGLLSAPFRPMLERLMAALRDAGFELDDSPWKLEAYDFGVPQRRRRLFLVGARAGLTLPAIPVGAAHVTAGEAIGDLLALSRFPASSKSDELELSREELQALESRASGFVAHLRAERPTDLSAPRLWNRAVLTGVAGTLHREDVRIRLASIPLGERESTSRLPKLDPGKPSPTLRAGTGREHGSHTSVRPVHYAEPRVITVREAARLHAFPDWFRFHVTRWHALRQIGNSVPPPLGCAVAAAVATALGAQPSRRQPMALGDPSTLRLSLGEAALALDVPPSQLPPARRRAA